MAVWVNIDIPTKHFGIHSENRSRTPKYKGINKLLRDGGWLKFTSKEEAYRLYKSEYPTYQLVDYIEH
ncbi:hypothetical protein SAMN05216389_10188 [Oceanobacillus limi]|uniref:Uncharacterized protein n=1 Tax=Oceanobacillus limi TaxID=930131 RepID=A0A1H9Y0J5_9BACI|nr:hypothetical protein [Oceanobacillus limi]SES62146.1 hypothetical protein SAMN05216389_10188 [Oceanobacillus limi]